MTSVTQARKDFIGACIGLGVATAYYIGATHIPDSGLLIGNGVGADSLPRMLAISMGILGTILLLKSGYQLFTEGFFEKEKPTPEERKAAFRQHYRAAGMLGLGVLYLFSFETIGWAPAIFFLAIATAVYNGSGLSWKVVGFAASVTVSLYILFHLLLSIPMPVGIWPNVWASIFG